LREKGRGIRTDATKTRDKWGRIIIPKAKTKNGFREKSGVQGWREVGKEDVKRNAIGVVSRESTRQRESQCLGRRPGSDVRIPMRT
jgi:hypothetical protein